MVISFAVLLILASSLIRFYLIFSRRHKTTESIEKRQKELYYLNFLTSSAVFEKSSIEDSFPKYLNFLRNTFNWTYASFFRIDEERQVLVIRFTGYLPDWYMKEFSSKVLIRVGDASIGRAVATRQPTTLNSATGDPRFASVSSITDQTGYRALSCYPVMAHLKILGGFCIYSIYENIFSLHDTQFLFTCANLYGAILENKLLENFVELKNNPAIYKSHQT